MQSSRYNIFFRENEECFLLNTYSRKIIKVKQEKYESIKNALNSNDMIFLQNYAVLEELKNYGFVTYSNEESIDMLKQRCHKLVMGKTLHITMMMTYTCNFACVYCFQNHINNSIMTDEIIEHTIKFVRQEIQNKKIKQLYVEWFGGEPLIVKQKLLYLHKQFRMIAREYKIPYYSRITTNGYELDLETFQELYKNHCFIYYVSLDGMKEVHDRQRPLKNGEGTHDRIIKNLKAIQESISNRNFRVEIRVNNSTSTISGLKQFISEFNQLFNNDSRFALVLDSVQDWGVRTQNMKEDLIESSILSEFADYAREQNVELAEFSFNSLETQICQAAKHNAYSIFYDGSIIKCQMALEREKYKNCNIIGDVITGINKEKESLWVDDKFPRECEKCIALPLCFGKKCVFNTKVKGEMCVDIEKKLVGQIKLEKIMCSEIEEI